jgi:hypothetical protein
MFRAMYIQREYQILGVKLRVLYGTEEKFNWQLKQPYL